MDSKGQMNVAGLAISAVIGIIGIVIFVDIYAGLNTDNISSSAATLLNLVDLLLAAALIIGIIGYFAIGRTR